MELYIIGKHNGTNDFQTSDKSDSSCQESCWKVPRPPFRGPTGLTALKARQALEAKVINKVDYVGSACASFLMATPIAALVFGLSLINLGVPMETQFKCGWSCNATRFPESYLPTEKVGFIFYGIVSTVYAIAMLSRECMSCSKRHDNEMSKNELESLKNLVQEDSRNPLPNDVVVQLIPHLTSNALQELSFSQLEAYKKHDLEGFKKLLKSSSLRPLQHSFWHLLNHIGKAKNDSREQQTILSQKSTRQLLRAEPLLFERIVRIVHHNLLKDEQLQGFYSDLLCKKLVQEKVAKILKGEMVLQDILLSVSSGQCSLAEAFYQQIAKVSCQLGKYDFSLPEEMANLLLMWQESGDGQLQSYLTKEEIQLFIDYHTNSNLKLSLKQYYSILRVAKAFDRTQLSLSLEKKLADDIDNFMRAFSHLDGSFQNVHLFHFVVLESTIDDYISTQIINFNLENILKNHARFSAFHLPKTVRTLGMELSKRMEALGRSSEIATFVRQLQQCEGIASTIDLNNTVETWMSLYPHHGEKLYLSAQSLSFLWLQNKIMALLKSKPTLKSYWLNPLDSVQ